MGTVNVTLGDGKKLNLILGQQLENAVTAVVFDFSAWQTEFGSGTLGLSVQRHGDTQPYAVVPTVSGTNATWNISELDTAYKGVGEVQVTYTVGSVVKKSTVYKFTVYRSLGENGEYPSPGQTWQEEIEDELADVKQDLAEYEDIFTGNVDESVRAWLEEHPEATTTVENKSITSAKLTDNLLADVVTPKSGKLSWCIQTKVGQADYYALAVSNNGDTFTPVEGYENFLTDAPVNIGTDWQHFEENGVHIFSITYYYNDMDVYVAMTKDFVTWEHSGFRIGFVDASSFSSPYVWTPQIFKYGGKYYIAATVQEGIAASRQTIYGDSLERYSGIYCTEIEIDFDNFNITPKGTIQRISFPAITDRNGTEITINDYCMDAWFEPTQNGLYCVVNDRYTLLVHVFKLTSGTDPMSSYTLVKPNLFGIRNIEAPTIARISNGAWKICACVYSDMPFGEEKNVYCITNDFVNFNHYGFINSVNTPFTSGVGFRRMRNPSLFYMTDEQQFIVSKEYELKCNVASHIVRGYLPIYDGTAVFLNRFDVSVPPNTIHSLLQNNLVVNKISFTDYFGLANGTLINTDASTTRNITYDNVLYRLQKNNGCTTIDANGNIHVSADLCQYIENSDAFSDKKGHGVDGTLAYIADNICYLTLTVGGVSATTAGVTVCTLATNIRPKEEVRGIGFVGGGNAVGTMVRVVIYKSGDIVIYSPESITSTLRLGISYYIA